MPLSPKEMAEKLDKAMKITGYSECIISRDRFRSAAKKHRLMDAYIFEVRWELAELGYVLVSDMLIDRSVFVIMKEDHVQEVDELDDDDLDL